MFRLHMVTAYKKRGNRQIKWIFEKHENVISRDKDATEPGRAWARSQMGNARIDFGTSKLVDFTVPRYCLVVPLLAWQALLSGWLAVVGLQTARPFLHRFLGVGDLGATTTYLGRYV